METRETVDIREIRKRLIRFMMPYKFALDEMNTKINVLKQEFQFAHDYDPIEHIASRLKTPESLIKKVHRKGIPLSLTAIKENIYDIAGVRITCSFISDVYRLSEMLQSQKDITVVECKDYIKAPKPNGYKSLHLIMKIPVFMSDREENVYVEVQIRTIAMDFWASLEHKVFYKYDKEVPAELRQELKKAADTVTQLDEKMESIHKTMSWFKENNDDNEHGLQKFLFNSERFSVPQDFLDLF